MRFRSDVFAFAILWSALTSAGCDKAQSRTQDGEPVAARAGQSDRAALTTERSLIGEVVEKKSQESPDCKTTLVGEILIGECHKPPRFTSVPDCFTYRLYDPETEEPRICLPGSAIMEISGPQYLERIRVRGVSERTPCGEIELLFEKVLVEATARSWKPDQVLAILAAGSDGAGELTLRALQSQTGTKILKGIESGAIKCGSE